MCVHTPRRSSDLSVVYETFTPLHPLISYHQGGPLAVIVEGKLLAREQLIPDHPHHSIPVLFIKRVTRFYNHKHPVLLLRVLLPEQLHIMYPPLYPILKSKVELFSPIGFFGLRYDHHQDAFGEAPPTCLSNSDRSDSQILIYPNQMSCHQRAILLPIWAVICKLLFQQHNNLMELITVLSITEKPFLDTDHVHTHLSTPSRISNEPIPIQCPP